MTVRAVRRLASMDFQPAFAQNQNSGVTRCGQRVRARSTGASVAAWLDRGTAPPSRANRTSRCSRTRATGASPGPTLLSCSVTHGSPLSVRPRSSERTSASRSAPARLHSFRGTTKSMISDVGAGHAATRSSVASMAACVMYALRDVPRNGPAGHERSGLTSCGSGVWLSVGLSNGTAPAAPRRLN